MSKKVLLGMSGGIDSSVAAFLLKEQGYEVIGAYMHFWHDTSHIPENELHSFPENKCCSTESLFTARQIGAQLGFPVYSLNYKDNFRSTVVETFLEGHSKGVTPNPCVTCNKDIKFGAFLKSMKELGCDYVATGHYARIESQNEKYVLKTGVDPLKDQSYFLYHLNQEQLSHILFPLGHMEKKEVKALAKKYGLQEVLEKKESQGVCFYPEESYVPFLERYNASLFSEGDVIYHGKLVGRHKGLPRYTIGQRRGIDIGGFPDPIYVIGFDSEKNQLIMGDNEELLKDSLIAENFVFTGNFSLDRERKKLFSRIRHLGTLTESTIEILEEGKIKILFQEAVRGITPGQNVVIYDEKENVIGGGIIAVNNEQHER